MARYVTISLALERRDYNYSSYFIGLSSKFICSTVSQLYVFYTWTKNNTEKHPSDHVFSSKTAKAAVVIGRNILKPVLSKWMFQIIIALLI